MINSFDNNVDNQGKFVLHFFLVYNFTFTFILGEMKNNTQFKQKKVSNYFFCF